MWRYLFGEHVPKQLIEKMFGIEQVHKDASQFILTIMHTVTAVILILHRNINAVLNY